MKLRRILMGVTACSAVLLIALALYPIRNTGIKALLLASILVVCASVIGFCRNRKWKVAFVVCCLAIIAMPAFIPRRATDKERLRADYVRSLESYRDTRYVWGGENHRGVDCSGLVRAAWIDAQIRSGTGQLNFGLVRDACSTWWFDASAQELGKGYGGRTHRVLEAPSVRAIDSNKLLAGDLAVVARGVHVLAYVGSNKWIEADPGLHKVIKLDVTDRNAWLDSPAVVVRWNSLD